MESRRGHHFGGLKSHTKFPETLSIEYQQTGYFVDRLYQACLDRPPSYEEYIHDMHQVGWGVEVGVGDWQQQLESNKEQFAEAFVGRDEFLLRYPASMTADQFVDEMFEYAGVEAAFEERHAAISAYGAGGASGRAVAMRSAMESPSVFRAYYNRAFVLAEYFGYLRRDPHDSPDANWAGHGYWLAKMDQYSRSTEDVISETDVFERIKRSEMVRAFVTSGEYRERFGQP